MFRFKTNPEKIDHACITISNGTILNLNQLDLDLYYHVKSHSEQGLSYPLVYVDVRLLLIGITIVRNPLTF